jgi:predicted AAA+ superfamily ATPase
MIKRHINKELKILLSEYPVVTILGPRQSGKTTLAKSLSKKRIYKNLEDPETRKIAQEDPKGFLKGLIGEVILDEIQRVPELLSYIQVEVDKHKSKGKFILTGSHQLKLHAAISQSLAGRTAILTLLPFSITELNGAKISYINFEKYIHRGFLPRIYDEKMRPFQAYANYYKTYVERDVRSLINIKDISLFEKFMHLLAGRVGQIFDYTSIGNDVGVDQKTIKSWLSVLEASFIIYKLTPYFENFGKRIIKSPKYYFIDVGLLAYLLGLQEEIQITRDPLVGNIFENLVIVDLLKKRLNQGLEPNLYFFRDSKGHEIDLIYKNGRELHAIEIKSSSTYSEYLVKNIIKAREFIPNLKSTSLIFNGKTQKLPNQIFAYFFQEGMKALE